MAIDYRAGLSDDREYVFAEQPSDPEMRESVNTWVWDDGTDYGMPRIGVEAVADQWETHDIQFNLAFANGRILNMFGSGKVHDPLGADGKPRILGAGPIEFELVKPFEHWKARIRGDATVTSIEAQIGGAQPGSGTGEIVPVELEYDIRSAAPLWESGSLLEEAGRVLATQEEGDLMGGPRFEQLFRTTGTLRVGEDEYSLNGGGLRIRRAGVRRLAAFRGHVWQSTVFPSGRAFGLCLYPPRDDGKATFNEGFLFEGDGELIPAWVTDAPWLRSLEPKGQDTTVTLETEDGRTETIQGTTVLSTCMVMGAASAGNEAAGRGMGNFRLQQAICQYTWGDESATGMIERSSASGDVS
jgi:hypothetical protein